MAVVGSLCFHTKKQENDIESTLETQHISKELLKNYVKHQGTFTVAVLSPDVIKYKQTLSDNIKCKNVKQNSSQCTRWYICEGVPLCFIEKVSSTWP